MCLWLFAPLILTISVYTTAAFLHNLHSFQLAHLPTPWQVSVQVHQWHYCVGSIIAPNWVLTSAACTSGKIAKSLSVRVGSTFSNKGGSIVKLQSINQHPLFNSPYHEYDFSLLQLAEPLNYTSQIQTIKLPTPEDVFKDGQLCVVSGWGETRIPNLFKESSTATVVPIVNQQLCNNIYETPNIHNITNEMICAGEGNLRKIICRGDMGGPLMCRKAEKTWKLTGIVSWSEGCGDPNFPAVFARVQAARSWITEMTGI